MNILITLDFPPTKGGLQNYLFQFARQHLSERDLILYAGPPVPQEKKVHLAASLRRIPPLFYIGGKWSKLLGMTLTLIGMTRKRSIDTVYCGNVYTAICVTLCRLFFPLPFQCFIYGTELIGLKKSPIKRFVIHSMLHNARSLTAVSHYTRTLARELNIRVPIRVRYPAIEYPMRGLAQKRKKGNKEKTELLSVGRLVKHKGHHILLKALSMLENNSPWHLTIVGKGPERENLFRHILHYRLEDTVTLHSSLEDNELEERYQTADVFIFPSLELDSGTEGFGIALLEAMAQNIPIIAAHSGAIPEVLRDGELGTLYSPLDVRSLTDIIQTFLRKPEPFRAKAAAAVHFVREQYTYV